MYHRITLKPLYKPWDFPHQPSGPDKTNHNDFSQQAIPGTSNLRKGTALVEMALLAPILMLLIVIAVDFGRIFYCSQIVVQCARNGALYACDGATTHESRFTSLEAATLASAPSWMANKMSVQQAIGADTYGRYVQVTITYNFATVSNFPWLPSSYPIVRSTKMRILTTAS